MDEQTGDCVSHRTRYIESTISKEELAAAWEKYVDEQKEEWDRFMAEPSDCTSYGRTIIKNLDGSILVTPEAPKYIDDGSSIWYLNDIGRKRWANGQSLRDWRCFEMGICKSVFEKGFL